MGETFIAPVAVFGHGFPREILWYAGWVAVDITRPPEDVSALPGSRIAEFLEPFLDPYVRAFLLRLEQAVFDGHSAVIFLREAPGALYAYQYALEFRRLGLLPENGPELFIFNLLASEAPEAARFNTDELQRLQDFLAGVGCGSSPRDLTEDISRRAGLELKLAKAQADGVVSATDAFNTRLDAMRLPLQAGNQRIEALLGVASAGSHLSSRRFALLGAPLAGDGLHRLIDECGLLAVDLQLGNPALESPQDLQQAVGLYAGDPFAPRQARPGSYVEALAPLLNTHKIETVVWQVDPADDLWGWLMPDVRDVCRRMDIEFIDLGFVPAWPDAACLAAARARLGGGPQ